jgi:hypothetical protein
MAFYTDLRTALKSRQSRAFVKASNTREIEAKLADLTRPTVRWITSINKLDKGQLALADIATTKGWQVWGVVKRVYHNHHALVLRSVDRSCWGIIYPGSLKLERVYTTRLLLNWKKTDWAATVASSFKSAVGKVTRIPVVEDRFVKAGPVKANGMWATLEVFRDVHTKYQ